MTDKIVYGVYLLIKTTVTGVRALLIMSLILRVDTNKTKCSKKKIKK